ncbi:glycosyltransferase [Roseiconus nitratireducens]|uniref:glycosyltransferase n=1 Tax=Roseiconus nitratireducens TaxID=2605748 RepID=UPI00191C35AF|nr:glycosyltransferase [Roseiconus nitratireducens]
MIAIARNEGQRLKDSLHSVVGAVPKESIVYVDSGSSDGSVEFARSLGVHVVELDRTVPFTAARARNAGFERLLSACPGVEYVQFLDGDCVLRPDWIDRAVTAMDADDRLAVVCGRRRELHPGESIYNSLIDREWDTPVGPADACGGDALFRRSAVEAAGGYDATIIAGEEPELCFRLRQAGWKVQRLDAEMTLHDAALTRFGQWWKRSKRFGHAAAEALQRYGSRAESLPGRQVRGIVVWGGVLPALLLIFIALACLGVVSPLVPVAIVAVYLLQWARLTRQFSAEDNIGFALRRAALMLACKPAEFRGLIQYWSNRILRRRHTLIEYKRITDPVRPRGAADVE